MMAGKIVGLGFEIISKLDSYFFNGSNIIIGPFRRTFHSESANRSGCCVHFVILFVQFSK